MSYLGIDIGTSGAKAAAVDRNGNIIALAQGGYALKSEQSGWFELDPAEVWDRVKGIIRSVAAQTGGDDIEMICVSSLGESFVLMDEAGEPLANSAMFYDLRGDRQSEQLEAFAPSGVWMSMVGLRPHRQQSLPKLMWLAQHRPELLEKTKRLQFFGDYILTRLGAPHVTDASLAFTSMMLDFRSCQWRPEAVSFAGIAPEKLPEVHAAGTILGRIDSRIARELGLSEKVRLVLGGHDQMMCALGCGVVDEAAAANSMGTTDAITPVVRGTDCAQALFDSGFRLAPFSVMENMYASSVFNLNGGALMNWFHNTFGAGAGGEAFARMEAEMPDAPTEITFLPNFSGRQDASGSGGMTGAVLGLNYDVTAPMFYKALLEGQAFELKMWLDRFEAAVGGNRLLQATGGAAQSDKNLQLRADIFGKPIARISRCEAGVLGNAMVCCVAAGEYSGFAEAARHFVQVDRVFEPDAARAQRYAEAFEQYKHRYEVLG